MSEKLKANLINFDFIIDKQGNVKICEMNYGFAKKVYIPCEGYWDKNLEWHECSNFDFCGWNSLLRAYCINNVEIFVFGI